MIIIFGNKHKTMRLIEMWNFYLHFSEPIFQTISEYTIQRFVLYSEPFAQKGKSDQILILSERHHLPQR